MIVRKLLGVLTAGLILSFLVCSGQQESDWTAGVREVNHFLNLWLVKRDYKSATAFLTDESHVCGPSPTSEVGGVALLPPSQANEMLTLAMSHVGERLGPRATLAEAIETPPSEYLRRIEPLRAAAGFPFTAYEIPIEQIEDYACEGEAENPQLRSSTLAMEVVFLFRVPPEETGGMYFVFRREGRNWRIVGFNGLRQ